mmetsp:Transcript_71003/g.219501  ORF Transcript_71003/g.219501 Transcript_71003/m.219501 type:complete len:303 (+) Transcript_71003:239-1147(+)
MLVLRAAGGHLPHAALRLAGEACGHVAGEELATAAEEHRQDDAPGPWALVQLRVLRDAGLEERHGGRRPLRSKPRGQAGGARALCRLRRPRRRRGQRPGCGAACRKAGPALSQRGGAGTRSQASDPGPGGRPPPRGRLWPGPGRGRGLPGRLRPLRLCGLHRGRVLALAQERDRRQRGRLPGAQVPEGRVRSPHAGPQARVPARAQADRGCRRHGGQVWALLPCRLQPQSVQNPWRLQLQGSGPRTRGPEDLPCRGHHRRRDRAGGRVPPHSVRRALRAHDVEVGVRLRARANQPHALDRDS